MPGRYTNENTLRTQWEVPDDHVIVRDHNHPDDPIIPRGSEVDLADGSVFYSVPECDLKVDRKPCRAEAKHVVTVSDRPETFVKAEQTGRSIRDFFKLDDSVDLYWDSESPDDQKIEDSTKVDIREGNVFVTRKSECQVEVVSIEINGTKYEIAPGKYSGSDIKKVPVQDISATDELSQFVDGEFKPVEPNDLIKIVGGEVFASNAPSGGAS